eukprot:243226_1
MLLEVIFISTYASARHLLADDSWHTGSTSLPNYQEQRAIGYNSDTDMVYLIGGDNYPQQFTSFDLSTNAMTDYGTDNLTIPIECYGQIYAQKDDRVYIWDLNNNYYIYFSVTTLKLYEWNSNT